MPQLSLNITPCLAYAPGNFLLHHGARSAYENCRALLGSEGFRVCFIVGGRRCGKTHFSIKLADTLMSSGCCPHIIEGSQCQDWIVGHSDYEFCREDVVLIDDAERFLETLKPGGSGTLVAFIEKLRVKSSALVFFSALSLDEFSFDEHVRSRLMPGNGFSIGQPDAGDMAELIQLMARQRGIALSDRKVRFLEKRIDRDIPSVEAYLERLTGLSRLMGKPIRFPLLGDAI